MKICGLMKTTLLDYPGHVACTVFTGGCNFRCPFCHNAELLDIGLPSEYTEEEIFAFLHKRKGTLEGVVITGGEPTMQADLPEFLRKIKEETGLHIKLDTNGTNPSMLKQLLDEGLLSFVSMDVKAGTSNYGKAAGVSVEAMERMMKYVEESRDILLFGSTPYEFRTTVVDGLHNKTDFEEIGPWIKGCKRYYLQCFKDSDNVLNRKAGFTEPKAETLKHYAELVRPYVTELGIRGIDL